MRVKAIPMEISNFAEKHTMLMLLGGALLAYGGYTYIHNRSVSAAMGADTSQSSTSIPNIYSVPQLSGGSSGSGIIDSVTNPNAMPTLPGSSPNNSGGSQLDWSIFGLEQQKEADAFTLQEQALNLQIAALTANTDIAMRGIQAANWSTDAAIAQAFLVSGAPFMAGSIGGQTFAFLAGTAPNKVYSGKNQKQVLAAQQSQFSSFMSQFGSLFSGPQQVSGTSPTTSFVGSTSTNSMSTGGSVAAPAPLAGSSSSSTQSSTGGGGSGGGTLSGSRTQFALV